MNEYKFKLPIQIRYSDLDPQWHVNNARYLSFIESARLEYLQELGLWDGKSFLNLGLIVASVQINYLKPILMEQKVLVGVKVTRIGNKSLDFSYVIEDVETEEVMATASTIMVTYSYEKLQAVPVSVDWRKKIALFDGIPEFSPKTVS